MPKRNKFSFRLTTTTIAHYHWLMMIDADWCWLILIGADWFWLILIDADWCFSKFQPGSERTSGVSSVIFSVKAPILQGIVWKLKMYENFPKKEIYESKICIPGQLSLLSTFNQRCEFNRPKSNISFYKNWTFPVYSKF